MSTQKELCWIKWVSPFGRCYVRKPDGTDDKGSGYSVDRDGNVYTHNPATDTYRRTEGATIETTTGEPFRFNGELSVWEDIEEVTP